MSKPVSATRVLTIGLSVVASVVGVAVTSGCHSSTAVPVSHDREGTHDREPRGSLLPGATGQLLPESHETEQPDDHWQEQFQRVLVGASDTLLLEAAPITPEQLTELSQLDGKLTQLLIDAGGANDAALVAIAKVRSLVHLRLRASAISDQGIVTLVAAGLPELQILNIPQGKITARGIASLAALPKLVQLRLGGEQLDDAAVAEIARLPKLRSLHLVGPSLSDAALRELSASPLLTTFYVDDCPLSDAAWEELFEAKPNLHVHVDQAHHDRDPKRH